MKSPILVLSYVAAVFAQTSLFSTKESGVTFSGALMFPDAGAAPAAGIGICNNGRFGINLAYVRDNLHDTDHTGFAANTFGGSIEIAAVKQDSIIPFSLPLYAGYIYSSAADLDPEKYLYIYSHEFLLGLGASRDQRINETVSIIPECKFQFHFGKTTEKEVSKKYQEFPKFFDFNGSALKPAVTLAFQVNRLFSIAVTPAFIFPFGDKNGQSRAFMVTVFGIVKYS